MNRLFWGGIAAAAFTYLAGCSGINESEVATFSKGFGGEFGYNGTHTADIAVLMDVKGGTFEGSITNFKFSRRGFDSPSGSIPISGTLGYDEDGKLKLKGTGKGTLSQAGFKYEANITIESGWVHPRLNSVNMWYFGGGGLTRWGRWVDWIPFDGEFQAEVDCKTSRYGNVRCPIPDLSLTDTKSAVKLRSLLVTEGPT